MALPKFIITMDGYFRLGMVSQHKDLRTVVNAVLGECIWNLSYNERRMAIELELTKYL